MPTESAADAARRLQGCINDLVAILALPAVWTGYAPSQIAETLLGVLLRMLHLDLAYLRLNDAVADGSMEWARWTTDDEVQLYTIRLALEPWLTTDAAPAETLIPNPIGVGLVRIARFRVGLHGELARLIVGSARSDFPTATERLLIQVAANQAAIGLQEARLVTHQRRTTDELEQRVRERTAELAALNRELRKENADRIRAERLNRTLAGRLISSQEAERTRIARELHDGVCQELASVAVDVSYLRQKGRDLANGAAQEMLDALQRRMSDAVEMVRLLSHGLDPAVLHHIGLAAALHAHCAEVERQHQIRVTLRVDPELESPRQPVALALFRIGQEALRNAAKHARASHVTVSLKRHDDMLRLRIADDGQGFDLAAARTNAGLGLASIKARARLVRGKAVIVSRPGNGTVVHVRVPVHTGDESPGIDREQATRAVRRANRQLEPSK